MVRTNLLFSSAAEGGRALIVTSTQPRRRQDHHDREPRHLAGRERSQGPGGGRRPAAADAAPALRDLEDPGPFRRHRRQEADLGGDPVRPRQGAARPALRVHPAESRRAPGVDGDARHRPRAEDPLRLGPHRHAAGAGHGRHARPLPLRGRDRSSSSPPRRAAGRPSRGPSTSSPASGERSSAPCSTRSTSSGTRTTTRSTTASTTAATTRTWRPRRGPRWPAGPRPFRRK